MKIEVYSFSPWLLKSPEFEVRSSDCFGIRPQALYASDCEFRVWVLLGTQKEQEHKYFIGMSLPYWASL